jgi:hypothetical protein
MASYKEVYNILLLSSLQAMTVKIFMKFVKPIGGAAMTLLGNMLLNAFLYPGDLVRRKIGMTVEEDGGMLRSIVNMIVWGTLVLLIWFQFFA